MWTSLKRQVFRDRPEVRDSFYNITKREKAVLYLKSMLVMGLINYCFYQNIWMFLPLLGIGAGYYRLEKKDLMHRKKETVRQQFKEMLLVAATGQKAGYSAENAFLSGYGDMAALYGSDSVICKMLAELKTGLENNLSLSGLWKKIGENCGIEEVVEFSQVFAIAKESGGNMTDIMERTALTLEGRMETRKEIEVLISAKRLEQKIMNAMPFMLMLYINVTSPGYFKSLYHSFTGMAVMTVCLMVYLAAYLAGVRLSGIEV